MDRPRADKNPHRRTARPGVGRELRPRPQDPPRRVAILGRRGFLSVSGDREQRIAAIARMQRGRVTRRQLLAAGVASTTICDTVRRGLLLVEYAGVYCLASMPLVPLARETAALLACHGRALLSHRSAAALWGLIQFPAGPVELTVVGTDSGRGRSGIKVHRTGRLIRRDTAVREELPVTSPARTLLDLCACAPPWEVERALDEAVVGLKIVQPSELEDVVARAGSRPGSRVLRDLLSSRGGGTFTESEAERRFLSLIRKAGLPLPETQVPIRGFRVDFLWRDLGVVFEIDGHRYHSSRSAFNRDRRKDAVLKGDHLDPNHVARDELEYHPLMVVAQVATALERARRSDRGAP